MFRIRKVKIENICVVKQIIQLNMSVVFMGKTKKFFFVFCFIISICTSSAKRPIHTSILLCCITALHSLHWSDALIDCDITALWCRNKVKFVLTLNANIGTLLLVWTHIYSMEFGNSSHVVCYLLKIAVTRSSYAKVNISF